MTVGITIFAMVIKKSGSLIGITSAWKALVLANYLDKQVYKNKTTKEQYSKNIDCYIKAFPRSDRLPPESSFRVFGGRFTVDGSIYFQGCSQEGNFHGQAGQASEPMRYTWRWPCVNDGYEK